VDSSLRGAAEAARPLVFSIDAQQRITYVSANVRSVLDYAPADVVGTPYLDYVHPDDLDATREVWAHMVAGNPLRHVWIRLRTRQGRDVAFVLNAAAQVDEHGNLTSVAGIGHEVRTRHDADPAATRLREEIDGLRQAGESLTQSRELSQVFDYMTRYPVRLGADACWVGLFEEETLEIHPVAHRGPIAEEVVKVVKQCAQNDSEKQTLLDRAVMTRQIIVSDLDAPDATPSPFEEEARRQGCHALAVVPMACGERTLGAICIGSRQPGFFEPWKLELLGLFAQSATMAVANAKALEHVRQSETRFRNLIERLPCVAFVVKPGSPPQFIYISGTVESFTGFRPDDFYANGDVAFRCVHPDDCERVGAIVRDATLGVEPYTIEYRLVHRTTGAIRHVSLRSAPQLDAAGNVLLRQGVILDVTEQKGLEHELLHSQRLAAIGEMAAMMAHEIRNPLAGMSLALRMLGTTDPTDDLRDECIRDLDGCLQRINTTVSRVLDFGKARPLDTRPCHLRDILGAAQDLTATYVRKCDIQSDVDLPPDLPGLVADPDQLEQVFVNLILNACKAMPDGGRIAIRAWANAHAVYTEVSDSGIGIPPENMDHIFDTFYSGFGDGAGLGLPLCRRIVAAHGGTIRVESTPGQGSIVRIELPLEPTDAPRSGH